MADKTFAFLTGCSRSGTTVLTRLLNRHPDVAIGFERFAYLAYEDGLTPDLYAPERFNDFRPGDSHHRSYDANPERKAILTRIADAPVIGDKLPDLIGHLGQLDRFPNWRIVFILREPFAVARSFKGRADRAAEKGGAWPVDRSYETAVAEYNEALHEARWLSENRKANFLLVNYEELFLERRGLDDIFGFLGVDPARCGSVEDIFNRSQRLVKTGSIDPITLTVSRGIDLGTYQTLSRTAGQSADLFSARDLEDQL